MNAVMSNQELRSLAARFIHLRTLMPTRAWPHIGQDVFLVEEDGPAGSLLFACRTEQSMSNPMGIVHGGVTASLVDTCMGVACTAQSGGLPTPTVTMTVNYARPVPLDREIPSATHRKTITAPIMPIKAICNFFIILIPPHSAAATRRASGRPPTRQPFFGQAWIPRLHKPVCFILNTSTSIIWAQAPTRNTSQVISHRCVVMLMAK